MCFLKAKLILNCHFFSPDLMTAPETQEQRKLVGQVWWTYERSLETSGKS